MSEREKFPATALLAKRMFAAEYGHTGLRYEDFADSAQEEWERKAGRMLEGLWDKAQPFVIIDLGEDELWLVPSVGLVSEREEQ